MSKWCIGITWDDVPHLSAEDKEELWGSIPPYQRDARTKGIPALGSGVIYPVSEDIYRQEPFQIPQHWPRAYALDVGWNRTAAIWGAWNRDNDTIYLYDEYYVAEAPPQVHADGIRARGFWIPGVIDPASAGSNQKDGTQLIQEYRDLQLDIAPADNSVEAGIHAVYRRLISGRLKVFTTCFNWQSEARLYRRDEKGKIVKERDHLMDCLTGDTMVDTPSGPKRIDSLPESGVVIGPDGRFVAYDDCGVRRKSAPVLHLTLSDGRTVRCTPEHRFLSHRKWVKAVDLKGRVIDNCISQSVRMQWPRLSFPLPVRAMMASVTTSAASIFSAMGSVFTAGCGATLTARSRRAITSIMWTRIEPQMSWTTCPSLVLGSMYPTTRQVTLAPHPSKLLLPPLTGTQAPRAGSGTSCITKRARLDFMKEPTASAISAALPTARPARLLSGFAPMRASQWLGGCLAWMMRSAPVEFACRLSRSIDSERRKPARAPAPVSCLEIRDGGNEDVYCMNVPRHHAFSILGGLVTHNCTRYLIMSGMSRATTEPVERYDEQPRGRDERTGY